MDTAYDAIQQTTLPEEATAAPPVDTGTGPTIQSLSAEVSEALQTLNGTAWGARISGLWENVKKQGEAALDVTKQDITAASELATSLSEQMRLSEIASQVAAQASQVANQASQLVVSTRRSIDVSSAPQLVRESVRTAPESTSKMFNILKQKAQGRIEELEQVEFAKYFNQVGKDVGEFLKSTVTIEPGSPEDYGENGAPPESLTKDVLFDLPDDIKRQIYTTRLDAQVHALHTSPEPFLAADQGDAEYDEFAKKFEIDSQTATIAADLDRYPELRKLMESLVPEKITYSEFWKRYYFLREQINLEESRRKQLLAEAGNADDQFDWDEDDEEDQGAASGTAKTAEAGPKSASDSTETLKATAAVANDDPAGSKTTSSRPSSESSYDVVSATASTTDIAGAAKVAKAAKAENSDEEDWE
ncbi:uncharacterized protein V1518DRAFT_423862 [Limtongia smithiae]|uniref:uncharacterized protein n=1 Tax=Limtongia smithiae TaxID=1125753 RepID=UPI0034CFC46A